MRTKPYRVIVWGPGGIGKFAIRELLRLPEFELVGVRAFSPDKNGVDAGTLVGLPPTGVFATTDVEKILKVDCDCILHTARDIGGFLSNDELLQMLQAGRNVITVHPFQHIEHMDKTNCPPDFPDKLRRACQQGQAVFHSTGLHPELVCDRIAGAITGLCTDISSIRIEENWDVSHTNGMQLSMIGFGKTPDEASSVSAVANMTSNFCLQNLHGMASTLGVSLDRTEVEHVYATANRDLTFAHLDIPEGTVGRLTHFWRGYSSTIGPDAFITIEINWMMGRDAMLPAGTHPDHYYVITIEGKPSVKVAIDIKSSMATGQHLVDPADPSSEPGYYSMVSPLLQAIPRVCAAAPGILAAAKPRVRWTPNYFELAEDH